MNLPDIPEINDDELRIAVSALMNSADIYRKAFLHIASGGNLKQFLEGHRDLLVLADNVIDAWSSRYGGS